MNFGERRVSYPVGSVNEFSPANEPSADLTLLLASACIALALMRVLCALSTPSEVDDPTYSITVASSFG
jgi:hypothetical protein